MKYQEPLKETLASRVLYDDLSGKEKEIDVLEDFLKKLKLSVHQIDPSERPDFFIHFNQDEHQKIVGCELTSYYIDSYQNTSSAGSDGARFFYKWKRFSKRLREALDNSGNGLEYLYGAIHFHEPSLDALDKFNLDRFLEEIVKIVSENPDVPNIENFDANIFPILLQNVNHIYLRNTAPEIGILWWCAHLQSGSVDDPVPGILDIIEEKNKKARNYEWQNADERWLIIFAKAEILADTAIISSDPRVSDHIDQIYFDRIFLWDKFLETISEIYPIYAYVFNGASEVSYNENYPVIIRPFIIRE